MVKYFIIIALLLIISCAPQKKEQTNVTRDDFNVTNVVNKGWK